MTPEQYARLPRYATALIENLRRELQDMTTQRDELHRQVAADPEGSNTLVDYYKVRPDLPLGHDPLIRFENVGGVDALSARLTRSGDALEVSGTWTGLVVIPRASNVIHIKPTHP